MADEAQKLAWLLPRRRTRSTRPTIRRAVGPHMTNTDSGPFMDLVPAISLRENERGMQIGGGWDPHVASADRRLRDVHRQGFPSRPERRADDAGGVAMLAGAKLK